MSNDSGICIYRQSPVANRQSPVTNRQSPVANRQPTNQSGNVTIKLVPFPGSLLAVILPR